MAVGYKVERGAVILAGGDGTRLSGLVHNLTGGHVPKQFCSLLGDVTMLERTRRRVEMAVPGKKTLFVVNESHEQHYRPILADVPKSNLVVQPENRGTAPAIALALLRMAAIAPDDAVAIFPADHFLSDEREFMRHVEMAFEAVEERPELTVVLGMEPSHPEVGYGWIKPAERISFGRYDLYRVAGLCHQPDLEEAVRLLKCGGLWNSAITVGRLSTIMGLIMVTAPKLHSAFAPLRAKFPEQPTPRTVAGVYRDLPAIDFSEYILAAAPVNLAVLHVPRVRWVNLAEPGRLRQTWHQLGIKPLWSVG
jgi:mannose-1-phosphate guanylyltransferase